MRRSSATTSGDAGSKRGSARNGSTCAGGRSCRASRQRSHSSRSTSRPCRTSSSTASASSRRSCATGELGSNTFGARERAVSERARELALDWGKPVIVDVNLRLHRWPDADTAVSVVRRFCRDALLVKVSGEEARLLTGETDPAWAASVVQPGEGSFEDPAVAAEPGSVLGLAACDPRLDPTFVDELAVLVEPFVLVESTDSVPGEGSDIADDGPGFECLLGVIVQAVDAAVPAFLSLCLAAPAACCMSATAMRRRLISEVTWSRLIGSVRGVATALPSRVSEPQLRPPENPSARSGSGLSRGWRTGLEPATTGTTTRGSTN